MARGFSSFFFLLFALIGLSRAVGPLRRREGRTIVTTDNSDYFGFDLGPSRISRLEQCKTACLGNSSCRAFTYNTKAKWCFLKSDYNQLKPFSGAVAGKVVNLAASPTSALRAELTFFPAWMADEARQVRQGLIGGTTLADQGLAALVSAGEQAMLTRPARRHAEFRRRDRDLARRRRAVGFAGPCRARDLAVERRRDRAHAAQCDRGRLERLPAVAHQDRPRRRAARHGASARPPRLLPPGAVGL